MADTLTRRERKQLELDTAIADLASAEVAVETTRLSWEQARADRQTLIREVGDLRAGLGLKRDGTGKTSRKETPDPDGASPEDVALFPPEK